MLLEMSCLQSKSISASGSGKTKWLLEGSKELQASSVSYSVNIFSNFLHNKHIMPTAYLPIQFKGLEEQEMAYFIKSSLFCAKISLGKTFKPPCSAANNPPT